MSKQQGSSEEAVTAEVISIEPAATEAAGHRVWPGILALFSLMIAAAAAAASGWLWWQAQQVDAGDARQFEQLQQRVARVEAGTDQLGALRSAADQLQKRAALGEAQLNEQRAALDSLRDELQSVKGVRKEDWMLAEAEYLLRLANQSVVLGHQADAALAMLSAADDILRGRDDPRWYPVRKAIAEDMAALEVAAEFDIEGIYLKLATLITRTSLLELRDRGINNYTVISEGEPSITDSENAAWWQRLRATLDQYIVIRQRSEPIEPLLPATEDSLLRMNLNLLLEQAQAALLAGEPVIYRDALMRAQQLIARYFDPAVAVNAVFDRQLAELLDIDTTPPLPDISGALLAMREVLRTAPDSAPVGDDTP